MKQNKRSKLLFLLNTIMVLLLVAVPVYGFVWNKLELGNDQPKVEVGELDEIEVMGEWLDDSGNKHLIPKEAIATKENEVNKLEYELTFVNKGNTKPTVVINVELPGESKLVAEYKTEVELTEEETKVIITFTLEVNKEEWDNKLTGNKDITITFELKG